MRKLPRQQRSRDMVHRIIEAGRAVLLRDGYDAFSTNRIAAEADISPGSLYQYFPNKDAIIAAILDHYWDDVADRVARSLADRLGEAGTPMIRSTAEALLDALEANADLLRVMVEQLPAVRNRERHGVLERRVRELAEAYIAARPGATKRPDPATTAWVITVVAENLAVRWVLDQPQSGREPITREALVDEIVALCSGYLLQS